MSASRVLAACLVAGLAFGPGRASADDSPVTRALTEAGKAVFWKAFCGLLPQDYAVSCTDKADPERCTFRNERDQPIAIAPRDTHAAMLLASSFIWGPLRATALALAEDDAQKKQASDMNVAFTLLSGGPLRTTDYPLPMTLSETALAWARAELLVPPDTPLCGQSAQVIYDTAFKPLAEDHLHIYAHLHRSGHLKKVTVEALDQANRDRRGPLWATCEQAARPFKKSESRYYRMIDDCRFWLRRAAVKQHEPLLAFLGAALAQYDPALHKKHRRLF